MYLQITTNCNMECAHCCMSSSSRIKGQNMSMATYKKALKVCEEWGEHPFLGGGEPTVHPDFWAMIGLALGTNGGEGLGVITNGKRKDYALALAGLAKRGALYVGLSRDAYHASIDSVVVQAFTRDKRQDGWGREDRDLRDIRSNAKVMNHGFAKLNGIGEEETCCCEELFVKPDGRIYQCGCQERQFGTVDAFEIPDDYEAHTCSRRSVSTD